MQRNKDANEDGGLRIEEVGESRHRGLRDVNKGSFQAPPQYLSVSVYHVL